MIIVLSFYDIVIQPVRDIEMNREDIYASGGQKNHFGVIGT